MGKTVGEWPKEGEAVGKDLENLLKDIERMLL
jgi:hypothetical protein